jgi:signal transduction histidine kinase
VWGGPRSEAHPTRAEWGLPIPRIVFPLCTPGVSREILRYAFMLGLVGAATLIRYAIDPWVGDRLTLFMAYAAVAAVTFLLGIRAGLIALLIAYVVNSYLFMAPGGRLVPDNVVDVFTVLLYTLAGGATLALAAWIHRRERDIREREWMAEARIAAQAADLARSNAELERFAEMVAHDLKEPLRGLSGNARRLLDGAGEGLSESGRLAASTMDRQSRRAIALVDSLLELAQAGQRLNIADVNLSEVLDEVLEDLAPLIAESNGEVVRQRLPIVRCDRVQVSRILKILITNSLTYNASDQKRVEVGVAGRPRPDPGQSEGSPAIFVRDNGIGIDPEDRERVFELFSRLRMDTQTGGTGLALVKRLVQAHGGTVWVESRQGMGSTFYFTLQTFTAPALK